MSRKFTFTLFLTATLITSVGCSGSRLRNLISRSDYQSLEDLEAEDEATANRDESTDASFVSQTETTEAEKKERRGLLNLSSLFRRNRDENEIDPDPFVEEPDNVGPEWYEAHGHWY